MADNDAASPATQLSATNNNTFRSDQEGNTSTAALYQSANASNNASIDQEAGSNTLVMYQVATTGAAALTSDQAGASNTAGLRQRGTSSVNATIDQMGASSLLNYAVLGTSAYQYSDGGAVAINLTQSTSDLASLFQRGTGTISATITEAGNSNELAVQQGTDLVPAVDITLTANMTAGSNVARLDQYPTTGDANATITQSGGSNKLVSVNGVGVINNAGTASQNSSGVGDINLTLIQSAGTNRTGLYQSGTTTADATINQLGGGNDLGSYQVTTLGFNLLTANQSGSDTATLIQNGGGDNTATINQ